MALPLLDHFQIRSFDGTLLDVQTCGSGDLAVVIANGLGGTLLAWSPLLHALRDRVRFVSWDYRGLYESGPPPTPQALRVEDHVRDMRCVFEAANLSRAVVAGWSMGVEICVQYAADYPESVEGLVLVNGTYGRIFDTAFDHPMATRLLPLLTRLAIRIAPAIPPVVGTATRLPVLLPALIRLGLVDEKIDREVFTTLARGFGGLDYSLYFRTMTYLSEHDGAPALPGIRVPLLMVTGSRDVMTPPTVARVVEREVPQAETFVVQGGTHYSLIEHPDQVVPRVESFLAKHFPDRFSPHAAC